MRRWLLLAILTAAVLGGRPTGAWAQDQSASPEFKVIQEFSVLQDVEYANVNGQSLKLDYAIPTALIGQKPPLVVWIHGGGWVGGSKANPAIAFLLKRGYAVASIAYRFSDKAIYPAQIHDCKGAIRFLRAQAAAYGFDPERVGVAGGSAGGHLAALLGASGGDQELEGDVGGNADQSSYVQAVVDIYGPTDLLLDETNGGEKWNATAVALVTQLLGGSYKEKPELAKKASPVYYVDAKDPPFLMIHGDQDTLVFLSQSKRLLKALEEAKVPAQLDVVEGAGHGGAKFGEPQHIDLINEFFDKNLKTATATKP